MNPHAPTVSFLFSFLFCSLSEEAVGAIESAWATSCSAIANASVKGVVMANELVDMEWKFGVTAASNELAQVIDAMAALQRKIIDARPVIREPFKFPLGNDRLAAHSCR